MGESNFSYGTGRKTHSIPNLKTTRPLLKTVVSRLLFILHYLKLVKFMVIAVC